MKIPVSGETTVREIAETLMARTETLSHLNIFISQDKAVIRAAADALDVAGAGGPLYGVPFCVKDNTDTAAMATTGGTPAFKDWRPTANALVVQSLIDAGGLMIGKTNLHELAFGISCNNPTFGAVGNPYNPAMIPGGSSGGTAAAVVAGLARAGLGTDTGGSCRIPAALCGCVGFRPTLGRYSQTGIIPLSSTRDTAGPLARTFGDVILLDSIIAPESHENRQVSLDGLRIGVPRAHFYATRDTQLAAVVDGVLDTLSNASANLIEVEFAGVAELNDAVGFPIVLYEVLREITGYIDHHGGGLTVPDVVAQVAGGFEKDMLASQLGDDAIPATVYRQALTEGRPKLIAAYETYFSANALVAMVVPTTPLPARPIGDDETVALNGEQVPTFPTYIRNTDPPSNAGLPCLSVPAGLTADGLPVGIEFVGPPGADGSILGLGRAYQAAREPIPGPDL